MKQYTRHKEVIIAFLEGKQVQELYQGIWKDVKKDAKIDFIDHYDYRIKPEPKRIPFDFSDAKTLIGRAVMHKDKRIFCIITDLTKVDIWLSNECKKYDELLSDYKFLDGTPCGKEVTE